MLLDSASEIVLKEQVERAILDIKELAINTKGQDNSYRIEETKKILQSRFEIFAELLVDRQIHICASAVDTVHPLAKGIVLDCKRVVREDLPF